MYVEKVAIFNNNHNNIRAVILRCKIRYRYNV